MLCGGRFGLLSGSRFAQGVDGLDDILSGFGHSGLLSLARGSLLDDRLLVRFGWCGSLGILDIGLLSSLRSGNFLFLCLVRLLLLDVLNKRSGGDFLVLRFIFSIRSGFGDRLG